MSNFVLVTGGLGYIGSHTVVKLIESNYRVIIVDNLHNSDINIINGIEKITGKKPIFFNGDIRDNFFLNKVMSNFEISYVIHFAGLKSVKESIEKPIDYYDNNILGTINLLKVMKDFGVKNIIFSSSCTVYGEPKNYPVSEDSPINKPKTPYGLSKLICEQILEDVTDVNSLILRYFNPIGNHKSGILFENPKGIPENLIPYIIGVIKGKYDFLRVFGNDYNTKDGTAIRDYIDVNDLAEAHVKSLNVVNNKKNEIINVGTGKGYSVMEIIEAFKNEGIIIPYKIFERRKGDIEKIYSNIYKSNKILNWFPQKNINDSIKSILKSLQNI